MVFGREQGSRGGPQAGARRAAPPSGGGAGPERGEREQGAQSAWQKSVDLYDSWHSALEIGIKVEFFKTLLTLTLAPVEKGKEGDDYEIRAGEKRYNRDDNLMAVLKPEDAIVFLALYDSFMAGAIQQAVLPLGREDGKRLVLAYAESYYEPTHPWYEALQGSMVFSIERDASDSGRTPVDEKALVFFSRPKQFVLSDAVDEATGEPAPATLYPEMMVLGEFVRGYIQGLPRQDFASVRLLDRPAGGRAASSETSGAQPRRLTAAPAGARPAGAGGRPAPAGSPAPGRQEGPVSGADIEAAIAGGGGLDSALSDDTPGF